MEESRRRPWPRTQRTNAVAHRGERAIGAAWRPMDIEKFIHPYCTISDCKTIRDRGRRHAAGRGYSRHVLGDQWPRPSHHAVTWQSRERLRRFLDTSRSCRGSRLCSSEETRVRLRGAICGTDSFDGLLLADEKSKLSFASICI